MGKSTKRIRYIVLAIVFLAIAALLGYQAYYVIDERADYWITYSLIFAGGALLSAMLFMLCIFRFSHVGLVSDIKLYKQKAKEWEGISHHVGEAGDDAFNMLPIGILVYDSHNVVIWKNPTATSIFHSTLIDESLESISKDLINMVNEKETEMLFKFENKHYQVIHRPDFTTIYFFDVTERENIKKRYEDRITGVGLIEISNLEESLKKYDMQNKVNLRGELIGEISQYFTKYNAYIQNTSDNRMTIMFDKESLLAMCEDKFTLFDSITEFKQKNGLKISVSMGISCYDNAYHDLGVIAQNALELAERRGGDQVIVNIEGEQIKPFGAKTTSLERNTQVEARINSLSLRDAVEKASNVIIMCHKFADTDAIGSALAAYRMIKQSRVDVRIAFDVNLADVTVKKIFEENKSNLDVSFVSLDGALELLKDDTLVLITDTQSPKLVMFPELYNAINNKNEQLFIIDHHRPGDEGYDNFIAYYQDQGASSSTEMITEMFLYYKEQNDAKLELDGTIHGIKISPLEASIMLSGIVVDTNNFTLRATQRTFEATGVLYTYGADMVYVRKLLQEPIKYEKFLSNAVAKAEIIGDKFSIVCLNENDVIPDRTSLAKISDKQLTISGVEASFTIGKIVEGLCGVSARSLGTSINVQTIMEQMGGGGHFNSSATQRKNVTIDDLKKELVTILELEYIDGGQKNPMKIILTQDVKGKGKKGDIVEVANGYANFLINNKQAEAATDENIAKLNEEKKIEKQTAENNKKLLMKFKKDIDQKMISVKIKVGDNGKIFGHVTTKLVCEEFENQIGIHLDKRKVELPTEINSIGIFTATVKLDTDIVAQFSIKVEAE